MTGWSMPMSTKPPVGSVISDWTGIPAGRMVDGLSWSNILTLADHAERARHWPRSRAEHDRQADRDVKPCRPVTTPNKPIGVFMLCGPSGVGKTETALALAESLYGGEQNIITINMSEFQEAHSVSLLKGAPPGYVGYGEGGG